jgi:hypothetical protein
MPDWPIGTEFFISLPHELDQHRASIAQVHDIHPGIGRRFFDLFLELMVRPGPLPRWQRELIATVVATTVGCHY